MACCLLTSSGSTGVGGFGVAGLAALPVESRCRFDGRSDEGVAGDAGFEGDAAAALCIN